MGSPWRQAQYVTRTTLSASRVAFMSVAVVVTEELCCSEPIVCALSYFRPELPNSTKLSASSSESVED